MGAGPTKSAWCVWGISVSRINMARLSGQRAVYSAEIIWEALEKQRDPGINWQVLEAMDVTMSQLLPLERRLVNRRTKEGLVLKDVYRVFCPAKAEYMLKKIGFADLMQRLETDGYNDTKQAFIMVACAYARAEQSLMYYAR
ncbi:hypothetical protein Loshitsa2_00015 [Erwinia phage Loshitsa2]|uniref:Uncharacterized protein n=2 Tax=Micantvirus TaxID=3424950 RepID=A0AAE9JUP8_9CAUD|nr:hypothetical protein Micant_00015 [Erwinia phage Micant]UNA01143.1 hypothetical protein Loshitsa2_00015 [Erwinia phage Loshitsa2]